MSGVTEGGAGKFLYLTPAPDIPVTKFLSFHFWALHSFHSALTVECCALQMFDVLLYRGVSSDSVRAKYLLKIYPHSLFISALGLKSCLLLSVDSIALTAR